MLPVCIASIQNVERNLLLFVSASDIPLRTIKFFSVLFSSAYSFGNNIIGYSVLAYMLCLLCLSLSVFIFILLNYYYSVFLTNKRSLLFIMSALGLCVQGLL